MNTFGTFRWLQVNSPSSFLKTYKDLFHAIKAQIASQYVSQKAVTLVASGGWEGTRGHLVEQPPISLLLILRCTCCLENWVVCFY